MTALPDPANPGKAHIPLDTAGAAYHPNDPRFNEWLRDIHPGYFRCKVLACHMGPDAHVYVATVSGPDGRQRTVTACVKHLELAVGKALSAIRLEPFE